MESLGLCTWRFMGSYEWGYKSPNMGYKYSDPTYNPTVTTHEPPSRVGGFRLMNAQRVVDYAT